MVRTLPGLLKKRSRRFALDLQLTHASYTPGLVQQAADCPDCNLGLPYDADPREFIEELLNGPQKFRVGAKILSWQAGLLRHDGKLDEAMRTCLTSLRLSRLLDREQPMMISALVVIACRTVAIEDANDILRSGVVSPAVRAELDKELVLIDDSQAFARVLKNERALSISHFGPVFPVGWYNRGIMNAWECNLLESTNEQLDLVFKPYALAAEAVERKKTPTQFDVFSFLSLPSFLKVRMAFNRTHAGPTPGVYAHRQRHAAKGRLEATSEIQLSALWLARGNAILDPFDGSGIKVRKTKGEWIIYSVGANLKDDGGDLESNLDVGLGPIPATRR